MVALKAFIGHSFTPDDENIVRSFQKFFNELKETNPDFSWVSAEAAQPKELADKVIALMQDKNLFIGICTRKESVILPKELKPTRFGNRLIAKKESFEPKTSDWIIQEIGLAIGKGMELILLIEDGLRLPGGLQGDKEYIPFDRESPEKSFVKLMQMINSLNPKAMVGTRIEAEVRTAPEEKEVKPSQETDWLKPDPLWDRDRYEYALMHTIFIGDKDSEQAIDQAYLATDEGKDAHKRHSWEAYHELTLLRASKGGRLTTLDQFAIDHPENADVLMYRAQGYQRYEKNEKAAQYFEVAAQQTENELEKLARYGDAAISYAAATRPEDAQRIINKMKPMASLQENGERVLLYTLKEIAKLEKADEGFCSLMEKLLDLHPDDINLRFDLAYEYKQKGEEELSLFHYLQIPYRERNPSTWNNLGVQFETFKLNSKSVNAYRESEKHDETLAMSNLAYKFIKAGFLEEAEEICNRALKIKDYHRNVTSAITRIKELPEEERKELKKIQEKAIPLSEFFRNYGHALAKETVEDHQGRWQGNECELSITIEGNSFKAEGSYERVSYNSLAGLLLGQPAIPNEKTTYTVKYEGTIRGKAVKATLTSTGEGTSPKTRSTILTGMADPGKSVLMIISDSLKEIQIYEKTEKEPKFFKFMRLS